MEHDPGDLVSLIPHRPPMHWLDEAVLDAAGLVRARRHIAPDHPFIHEGVLLPLALIEMLSQAAACGAAAQAGDRTVYRGLLAGVRDLVFHRPVGIGDTLTLYSRCVRSVGSWSLCRVSAATQAGLVAEGCLAFHIEYVLPAGVHS